MLNIVTGGGKTAIIAAVIAWLRIAHNVDRFVMLCPNLIVRDRLEDDFKGGKVFVDRDLIPSWAGFPKDEFELTTLGGNKETGWSSLLGSKVVLGNIHQFYQSNKSGQSNLSALMTGPDFAVFNDEAHNSPAPEYEETLRTMRDKIVFRMDTTATPDRADNRNPDSDMICEYGIHDALSDGVITTPVVYQPDIKTVQLTYTDAKTGERRSVEEIDWAEVDRLGLSATQWVTDDEPMRQQMAIALRRLQEQETRAKKRYQPILFVVAVCKADAERAYLTLKNFFKTKTLIVTEDSPEQDREKARVLGKEKKTNDPYKAVVSVLMLREGWDVPEVGVILLLRKFSSKVYGQQVVGRGLRRVRGKGISNDEPQICAIVDHPKLEHQWLWELFGSKIRENVKIDDLFDETEDLPPKPPKQELVKPENIIEVPSPDTSIVDDSDFDIGVIAGPPEPVANWKEVLSSFVYDTTVLEITKIEIDSVRGKELGESGWKTVHAAPYIGDIEAENGLELSDEQFRDAIKESLLKMASDLTISAGYASGFAGDVYKALIAHVREKFLDGMSLGLAERNELKYAFKMMPKVLEKVTGVPGLIAGVIEYASQ